MPVSRTEKAITVGARLSSSLSAVQPARAGSIDERDLAAVRELERVREQVLDDLLQALGVGGHRRRQLRVAADEEVELLRLGHVAERALHVAAQLVQAQLAHVHRDRARLDLRQVEDVVDEHEQVVARRVDRLRELHLLAGEVALGLRAQLVGEDQQRVERRAQLVRHVREELGLVLRGERQLVRLFLQVLAGLLHFRVLALHLLVLVGEQPRLLLQLLVGVLQLFLAALQLLRERLRLREQVFRPHVRLDRVDHDADRFRQLLEERLVGVGEALEGGQLEHALHLALEHHRQHEDVARRRGAQARGDVEVALRARWSAGSCASRARTGRRGLRPATGAGRGPSGLPRRRTRAGAAARCSNDGVQHVEARDLRRRPRAPAPRGSGGPPCSGSSGPAACA